MNQLTDMVLNTVPDEELVTRILAGEKRQFEALIRKYNQRLYRIGMSVLANEAEAEDAMQTTYINAYEHLRDFEGRSSFGTWLTRIMLNQCYLQKRQNRPALFNFEPSDKFINMKTPENELASKELGHLLEEAIARLPEKYRTVFVLREIEDMSVRETSIVLDIGEPNVKVRLNRAKMMLRADLGGHMKDHVYSFHLSRCDRIVDHVMAATSGKPIA